MLGGLLDSVTHRSLLNMADEENTAWLPLVGESPLTRALTKNFIKIHSHGDWFLKLAWAIIEQGQDETQGRMLAKAYLFFQDFLPKGLVGNLSHIHGSDLMQHLLCHIGEFSTSRHKITRDADGAFSDLERWMKKGANWREALKAAEAEGGKRKVWRAPALHSPAGLVALLVISHPDTRFRDRIGCLGIEWMMMKPRGSLLVRGGFWDGINGDNLLTCFRPEEARTSELQLIADYDQLLGHAFTLARKDMRPYLPPRFSHLMVEEDSSDQESMDKDEADGSQAELSRCLDPSAESTEEMESWLTSQLPTQRPTIAMWCEHWASRMNTVTTYEEQLIIRSLFLQSLCRLMSLSKSCIPGLSTAETAADAYMLLDIEDAGLKGREPDPDATQRLSNLPPFIAFSAVSNDLCRIAGNHSHLVDLIIKRQAVFFHGLLKHPTLCKLSAPVVIFDTLRTQVVLGEAVANTVEDASQARILEEPRINRLRLTNWQIRRLVLPGADIQAILTNEQLRVFRRDPDPDVIDMDFVDLTNVLPCTPLRHSVEDEDAHQSDLLRSLFGKLQQQVEAAASSVSSDGPRPQSSPYLAQSPNTSQSLQTRSPQVLTQNAAIQQPPSTAASINGSRPNSVTGGSGSGGKGSMPPVRELFVGKKFVPTKRGADGAPKVSPRVVEMTRDDLKEAIRQEILLARDDVDVKKKAKEELETEIREQLREALKDLKAELKSEMKAELKSDIKAELKSDMKADINRMSAEIGAVVETTGNIQDAFDDLAQINKLTSVLNRKAPPPPSPPPPPRLGEEGYLIVKCPAPDGQDQQACMQRWLNCCIQY